MAVEGNFKKVSDILKLVIGIIFIMYLGYEIYRSITTMSTMAFWFLGFFVLWSLIFAYQYSKSQPFSLGTHVLFALSSVVFSSVSLAYNVVDSPALTNIFAIIYLIGMIGYLILLGWMSFIQSQVTQAATVASWFKRKPT
jgi:hypothetical protein